ncbi:MAG: hypothetical protein IJW03_01880 [Clostridia bacterium]|nr:hypothetical protein [Clostridia bacterium]
MRRNYRSKIDKETKVKYTIDYSESKTLSSWTYFGLGVLYAVPVIGTILCILACSSKNKNLRNFARGFILGILLVALLLVAFVMLAKNGIITMDMLRPIKNFLFG